MRRLGIIAVVLVMVAAFVAMPVTVAKKTVDVPSIAQLVPATSQLTLGTQQAFTATVSISVPTLAWSNANAFDWGACDPSDGRHSGLAYSCFLLWLMEIFDASNSPY